jgi:hypothetical protein
VPRPANDLSETDRARWFEEQRPVIEAFDDRRIVYVESEPMPCYDRPTLLDWLWALPISLSFGYWSGGGHHDHDGWGVGTTIGGWH